MVTDGAGFALIKLSAGKIVRIDMPRTSNVILPYEPGYTGHWEEEKRRKETREWLRQRDAEIEPLRERERRIEPIAIDSETPK